MNSAPETEENVKKSADKPEYGEDDPFLDKIVLIFLIIFFLAVILIPSEWFLKASMWWNGIG